MTCTHIFFLFSILSNFQPLLRTANINKYLYIKYLIKLLNFNTVERVTQNVDTPKKGEGIRKCW